ncbi:hypothetical protein N8987_00665 [Crocinitomix sp.]|nr:hypothetical protein [Crocinitomix sp.]
MNINDISDDKEIKLPFCLIYEPTFLMAIALEKSIDINSLARIREGFVENYFNMEHHKTHPNVLFDFQKRIIDEGHFDAYSHWILMKGDPGGFNTWFESNEGNWDAFIEWFQVNDLRLSEANKFYSAQY